MINQAKVERAARELYERHGRLALEIAHERADHILRIGDHPNLDTALLVLNEVEKLVGRSKAPTYLHYSRLH